MRDQRRASLASAALGSETLSKRERQLVAFCPQQATNANAFSVKFELKGARARLLTDASIPMPLGPLCGM